MTQIPEQDHQPTPEQERFLEMLGEDPYKEYIEQYQPVIEHDAQGDTSEIVQRRWDFIKDMIRQFPPLKEAYNAAYPNGDEEEQND